MLISAFYFLVFSINRFDVMCFCIKSFLAYAIMFFATENKNNIQTYMIVIEVCMVSLIVLLAVLQRLDIPPISDEFCGTHPTREIDSSPFVFHCFIAFKMIIIIKCMKTKGFIKRICRFVISILILIALLFLYIAWYEKLGVDFQLFVFYLVFLFYSVLQFSAIDLIRVLKMKLKRY